MLHCNPTGGFCSLFSGRDYGEELTGFGEIIGNHRIYFHLEIQHLMCLWYTLPFSLHFILFWDRTARKVLKKCACMYVCRGWWVICHQNLCPIKILAREFAEESTNMRVISEKKIIYKWIFCHFCQPTQLIHYSLRVSHNLPREEIKHSSWSA